MDYKGTKAEIVDGETYQCETYETIKSLSYNKPKGLLPFSNTKSKGDSLEYKLYFKNGKLVRFKDNLNLFGEFTMIAYSNKPNENLVTVPKGYTIYADNSKEMGGLLKKRVVLERH